MLSSVFGTFSLKLSSAIASFVLLGLTTQFLGASGRGLISIIVTTVGLVVLVNGFVGGASLVFLLSKDTSRGHAFQVTKIAYLWAPVSSALVTYGAHLSGSLDPLYLIDVFVLGLLAAAIAINALLVLSAGNLFLYNATNFIQSAGCLVLFYLSSLGTNETTVRAYFASLLIAYVICFLLTAIKGLTNLRHREVGESAPRLLTTVSSMVRYGALSQLGNLLMYISFRLSFYVLGIFDGIEAVGIYSVGVALSESLWMISGSFAIVLYSFASRGVNSDELIQKTILFAKISGGISIVCTLALVCIPSIIFSTVFGTDFGAVRAVVGTLTLAMVSTSVSTVLNHYFSGLGMYFENVKAGLLGFLATIFGNAFLVPKFGFIGAGITASVASLMVAVALVLQFMRHNNVKVAAFVPNQEDIVALKRFLSRGH